MAIISDPYTLEIVALTPIQPGETQHVTARPTADVIAFRPDALTFVNRDDRRHFYVEDLMIGPRSQFLMLPLEPPSTIIDQDLLQAFAHDLREVPPRETARGLRWPMETVQVKMDVTVVVTNTSDQPRMLRMRMPGSAMH